MKIAFVVGISKMRVDIAGMMSWCNAHLWRNNMQRKNIEQNMDKNTEFTVKNQFGDVKIDLKEFEEAKKNAKELLNPPRRSLFSEKIQEFIGGEGIQDTRYYGHKYGALLKLQYGKRIRIRTIKGISS